MFKTANTLPIAIDLVEGRLSPLGEMSYCDRGSNPLLSAKADILSKGKVGKKHGFTLAEVLITLVLLGIVAAITIPSALKTQTEAANKTKIKKAITNYEKLIENMRITTGVTTVADLKTKMSSDNCATARTYFKIKKDSSGDNASNCKFSTNDGLWWDITDITNPVIAWSETCLEKGDACKGDDYNKYFTLTTTQGNASQGYAFIVNDPSGAACDALKFAKIISSDTECSSSTYTPGTTMAEWRNQECSESTKVNGKYAGCHESFANAQGNSGLIRTYDDQGRTVFALVYAADTGECSWSYNRDNSCDYGYITDNGVVFKYTEIDGQEVISMGIDFDPNYDPGFEYVKVGDTIYDCRFSSTISKISDITENCSNMTDSYYHRLFTTALE